MITFLGKVSRVKFGGWIKKLWCAYSGILLSNKNDKATHVRNNVEESQVLC